MDKMNAAAARSKAEMLDSNMTEEMLNTKVNEIIASRGKKGTDSKVLNRQLEVLAKISRFFGPHKEIPVLMHLISSTFDVNKLIDDYLDLLNWRSSYRYLARIVRILDENKKLVLALIPQEDTVDIDFDPSILKKKAVVVEEEEPAKKANKSNVISVSGSLETFITRLEADYTRSLQQINPHTQVWWSWDRGTHSYNEMK